MAAVEPVDELKECLRASVEMLLDKLNDRLHEDMDGVDYLCVQLDRIQNLVERASELYDIPLEIVDILRSAQDSLRSLATGKKESWVFNSTGCRGRPSFHIPQDMLQLYLDYGRMLYAVRCLKSNEDMILALAGQFKQLSHEPEKFR